jgi:transcriptional regulator with XRE-family HTH domain
MIHPEQLGSRIAERRRALGLTQGQVAVHMGVSPQAVSKWERGLACPDLVFFDDLAELLNVGVEELLVGVSAPLQASA